MNTLKRLDEEKRKTEGIHRFQRYKDFADSNKWLLVEESQRTQYRDGYATIATYLTSTGNIVSIYLVHTTNEIDIITYQATRDCI